MVNDAFRFPDSILVTKAYSLHSEYDEKQYSPFFVNRALSQHVDCIMYANQMNLYPDLPNKLQYDYYFHSIRQMKRKYGKWGKKQDDEELQLIMDYHGYSLAKAREVRPIFTSEQFKHMKTIMDKGG